MGMFLKDINLKGKTALITGATKGLGRGAALAIAEAGGNIIAIGRNQLELNTLKKEIKKLLQILIIIDDFADDSSFSRQSKLLHALFTRGRHSQISTIVATQKFTALHPIIRVNASELFVFRLGITQIYKPF